MKMDYIEAGGLRISFQRTCRVPEGRTNELPAGLGRFPIYRVADFKEGAPAEWREDGYFLPMFPQEAMWISFDRDHVIQPRAVIVGAGNINAVSGKPFIPADNKFDKSKNKSKELDVRLEKEQNYIVAPPQPWLDGWKADGEKIYQFVAAEMGSGQTVEGQITKKEKVGGIQFIVYEATKKLIPESRPHEHISSGSLGHPIPIGPPMVEEVESLDFLMGSDDEPVYGGVDDEIRFKGASEYESRGYAPQAMGMRSLGAAHACAGGVPRGVGAAAAGVRESAPRIRSVRAIRSMGLGRGGEIKQKIYPDPHGLEVWKPEPLAVENVYLISSEDFKQLTGFNAPATPVTYEVYQQYGLPWYELHDSSKGDTKGSKLFGKLKPVGDGKGPNIELDKLK